MACEIFIVCGGYALYYFQMPESWCRGSKFVQLYLTGFIIFHIFLLNFYYEADNIIYNTLKLNSGNYDDEEDNFWKYNNIFKKTDEEY